MIVISLNVTKIPPGRTVAGKNGAKYLDLVLIENKDGVDQYGNSGFCKIGATKEERENRVQLPIVGNWKRVGEKPAGAPLTQRTYAPKKATVDPDLDADDTDSIPF